MGGLFLIDRSLFQHAFFKREKFTEREAWLWMVAEAAWKPGRRRVGNSMVELSRGQFTHSLRFIADAWTWDKMKVKRYIKRLESETMIETGTETESGTGQMVVTICNYERFQDFERYRETVGETGSDTANETATRRQVIHKRDSNETATRQQRDKLEHQITPDNTRECLAHAHEADSLDANGRPTTAARSKQNYIPPNLNQRTITRERLVDRVGSVRMIGPKNAANFVDAWLEKGVPHSVILDKAIDAMNTSSRQQGDTLCDDIAAYIAEQIDGTKPDADRDKALSLLLRIRARNRNWKREWGQKPAEDDPRAIAADAWQKDDPVPEVFFEAGATA